MSINEFLKGFTTGDNLKDYSHASKLFVADNYNLSPKYGFLYHVAFDLNPAIAKTPNTQQIELGMLVKQVALPSFKINVKKQNAYNRWNYTQTKVDYDNVRLTFAPVFVCSKPPSDLMRSLSVIPPPDGVVWNFIITRRLRLIKIPLNIN